MTGGVAPPRRRDAGWLATGAAAAGWTAGWLLAWDLPPLGVDGRSSPAGGNPPQPGGAGISVIVPARDEAANLALLLDDLAAQRQATEVIVVDDCSVDATASIAGSHPTVTKVVAGAPLPPGWAGKPWALAQGADVATGDVLVFLDADVRLAADALTHLVAAHERLGGLVSIAPHHVTERWWERWSALPNLVTLMGSGAAWPGRRGRTDVAFGPCVVIGAEDYGRLGGHAAVAGEVVEDVALGRLASAQGLAVTARRGGQRVRYRMYPGGPRDLVEGWTKNLASGAGATRPLALAGTVAWIGGLLTLVGSVVAALRGRRSRVGVAALIAAHALQAGVLLRRVGRFGWSPVVALPLHAAAFVGLVARSAWQGTVRGRVRWRGRDVAVGARARSARAAGDPGG